ncbi:hypothetical protein Bca4012_009806 [Brassica carinata]
MMKESGPSLPRGIPPLVQILETGSAKAREDSATILRNLCNHSGDIRACVESADAVPALLWLLKNGSANGKEIAALLTSDLPESKMYVLDALKCLLSVVSFSDMLREGSASNDAIETMIKLMSSAKEETQANSASALAAIFQSRKDLRESALGLKTLSSAIKLLHVDSEKILVESSRCMAAILLSVKENRDVAIAAREALPTLISLANSSVLEVAEKGIEASEKVNVEEIILSATRILREGTVSGKTLAAPAIARLLSALTDSVNRAGTVLALVSLLESADGRSDAISEALDALAIFSRSRVIGNVKPAWVVLAESPSNQPIGLGNMVNNARDCVSSIAKRRMIENLNETQLCAKFVQALVRILDSPQITVQDQEKEERDNICICIHPKEKEEDEEEEATESREGSTGVTLISGDNLAIWVLSVLSCDDEKSRAVILESEGIELITDRIGNRFLQTDNGEDANIWVCALLLAILFQDREITRANATMKAVPVLSNLVKSEEYADRYFAAQALASLVCNGSRGTLLSVANSGAAAGFISLLGCSDDDIKELLQLSQEFMLVRYPDQVALERLFRVEDIRVGATSRKAIPLLVELLKPIPDRPGAPLLALNLLTLLAGDCPQNMIFMVESGALEGLSKYLSLGPQDEQEEAATGLLGILCSSAEIRRHESSFGAVSQLVAVLRLGGRGARYSAAKALDSLFTADHIRNGESSRQAVQPLVEILSTGSEREQHAAIAALVRLLSDNPSRALEVADVEMNAVDVLCRILSSNCSMELKGDAAELCYVLFANTRIRSTVAAARCVEPLVSLLVSEYSPAQHSVVRALDKLVDDEQLAELVAAHGAVVPLVGLLYGRNYVLHEAISRALVKLGKDRPACKLEMVKAGVIDCVLDILHEAPDFLCAAFSELLRILTNNATIAKGQSAAKVFEPLFNLLTRLEYGPDGQHSALQVLVNNILEHPQCRADYTLNPHQVIEPLIPLLDSTSPAVQQLAAELLSHLLLEEHLQKDPLTQLAIGPLIHVLGSGIHLLQQRAVKALVSIALTWPNEIAKEGGVSELSKVILQADPSLSNVLWESAASILVIILQFSSEFYLEVPVAVLVETNCIVQFIQVISTGPNPEWDESFSWSFESPPKGQKLHISCKNKSKMGKESNDPNRPGGNAGNFSGLTKITCDLSRFIFEADVAEAVSYNLARPTHIHGQSFTIVMQGGRVEEDNDTSPNTGYRGRAAD